MTIIYKTYKPLPKFASNKTDLNRYSVNIINAYDASYAYIQIL